MLANRPMPHAAAPLAPRPVHLTRLKSIWRSAGWPCRDAIELDLVAAEWIAIERDHEGRETLRLTDGGMQVLVGARQKRTRTASPHDRLAARVCSHLAGQGRIVWRELSLRAKVGIAGAEATSAPSTFALDLDPREHSAEASARESEPGASAWRMARPDVFSIRNTSVENYLYPVVHEIKANRADLLSDLRNPAKRGAYRWLSSETYYVFPAGLASPEEIPEEFGILTANGPVDEGALELVRPARHVACTLPFAVWMALAKATPVYDDESEPAQIELCPADTHERP